MFNPFSVARGGGVLSACSPPPAPRFPPRAGGPRATGQADTAAVYVTIENKGGADQLVGVRSSIGKATLHESAMEGDVMRMRPIDPGQGLSVPSNGKLVLAPGGAHVMITGLKKPLEAGDHFGLTMLFDKSRPHRVTVSVKPASESPMAH
jgi:copper(I)-binding protein